MAEQPGIQLHLLGTEALKAALRDTRAPHLPQFMMSDHFATADRGFHQTLREKIDPLLLALQPTLARRCEGWPDARADILALDLALVEHAQRGWALAWVEIQAFTSMLATFHTVHLAQRALIGHDKRLPPSWLPHDTPDRGSDWLGTMRQWMAPTARRSLVIEDAPYDRVTRPDFDAIDHWWGADLRDWRELQVVDGLLHCPRTGQSWSHIINRLIFSDLSADDRPAAEALYRAAQRCTWHSHPAWYDGLNKGTLADLPLEPHETCHWLERSPLAARNYEDPAGWIAKAAGGHSGEGLLLDPTPEQLRALGKARQWIVQRRFQQRPVGLHSITRTPLFGEIRCMVGLAPGRQPWLMALMLRCSVNGIATLSGRDAPQPGEGMTPLYLQPLVSAATDRVTFNIG